MVRGGFTLAEVIVSTTLLALAIVGLGGAAALAQRALLAAELQERAVRRAAALMDSLSFSAASGADSSVDAPLVLRWNAPAGDGVARLVVQYPLPGSPVTLTFSARRIPGLAERTP